MPDFRRRAVRESMTVRLDVSGMLQEAIGGEGVTHGELEGLGERATACARALRAKRAAGELAVYDLPQQPDMLRRITKLAAEVREEVETLVVLGIGGSALGRSAPSQALADGSLRVVVADNVDPWGFGALLDELDLTRTAFNVVSKSGETAETMAQFLIVRDRLLRAARRGRLQGAGHRHHRRRARRAAPDRQRRRLPRLGRARRRRRPLLRRSPRPACFRRPWPGCASRICSPARRGWTAGCAPRRCARTRRICWRRCCTWRRRSGSKNIVVLMPYSDRLRAFARWFAQLWAESLARSWTVEGARRPTAGRRRYRRVGATDQHSQLQLYLEGPRGQGRDLHCGSRTTAAS